MNILNILPYIFETRRYGHTYIHAAVRRSTLSWKGYTGMLDGEIVRATYCGWGRSLQTQNGHKYKAHLRYERTGKPVPSKRIHEVRPLASVTESISR
jgi:hypothetical protein